MAGPWFTVVRNGEPWQELGQIWVSNGEQDCPGRIEIKLKLVEAEDESDKQHPAYLVDHTLLN